MNLALAALGKLPIEWQIGLITAAVLGAGGLALAAYGYVDHQGYVRGFDKADSAWQVKWDDRELQIAQQRADEHDRQDTINTNAKLREREELALRQQQLDDLQSFNSVLQAEAALDPERDRIAFDAAATDRYNRFIARTPH